MASVNVRLVKGSSFSGHGYVFNVKLRSRLITNESDIGYFQRNPRFKVTAVKASARIEAAPLRPNPVAPSTDAPPKVLPWKGNNKKSVLIAAAISRDIAVTEDDKVAEIVQLLREWDEDHPDG